MFQRKSYYGFTLLADARTMIETKSAQMKLLKLISMIYGLYFYNQKVHAFILHLSQNPDAK